MREQLSLFGGIARCSGSVARAFYDQHHYIGGHGRGWTSFAYYNRGGEIGACVSFGTPASPNLGGAWFAEPFSRTVYELTRLASHNCEIPLTSFVSQAISLLIAYRARQGSPRLSALISYACEGAGHHGGIYQAMSWVYCGVTKSTSGFVDEHGAPVHRRSNSRNLSTQEALRRGYKPALTAVKHRYVRILGTPRQRRKIARALKYEPQSYPKPTERAPRVTAEPLRAEDLLITGESPLYQEIVESALDCVESAIRGQVPEDETCRYIAGLFEAWGEFDEWSRRVWFFAESSDLRACCEVLRERV